MLQVLENIKTTLFGNDKAEVDAKWGKYIDVSKNYQGMAPGHIFTGQQVLNLLYVSTKMQRAAIMLSVYETYLPASHPELEYGPAEVHGG